MASVISKIQDDGIQNKGDDLLPEEDREETFEGGRDPALVGHPSGDHHLGVIEQH